eukprot:COSAG05_NODE_3599_length_1967_cov_1.930942_1_plen_24_part_10
MRAGWGGLLAVIVVLGGVDGYWKV